MTSHPDFADVPKADASEPIPIPARPDFKLVRQNNAQHGYWSGRRHTISKDGLVHTTTHRSRRGRERLDVDTDKLDLFDINLAGLPKEGRRRRRYVNVNEELDRLSELYGGRALIPSREVDEVYNMWGRTKYCSSRDEEPLGSLFN